MTGKSHTGSPRRLQGGGLLLGNAMQCAEAPDQIKAVDRNDPSVREAACQNLRDFRVTVWLPKRRHEDRPIDD